MKFFVLCASLFFATIDVAYAIDSAPPPIAAPSVTPATTPQPPAVTTTTTVVPASTAPVPVVTTSVAPTSSAPTAQTPSVTPPTSAIPMDQFQVWLKKNENNLPADIPVPGSKTTTTTTTTVANGAPNGNGFANGTNGAIPPPPLGTRVPLTSTATKRVVVRKVRKPYKPLTYEEGQKAMMDALPTDEPPPSDDAILAFAALLQNNMPLTPSQVLMLRQQIDKRQRAAATPPNIPPKPVSSTIMVNSAPGGTPPAIRLAQGYVTSLVFVDSTGAPWPIAAFDIGDPKSVNLQWDGKSNILLIQSVAAYNNGNIVIRLVGLPTPITLELVSGQRVVDYRVDLHVSGIGPNTKELPVGSTLPSSANVLLLSVLDGVAPPGSVVLNVRGSVDSQAWLLGDTLFLRTRMTVLSPGWIGKMSSPDGMMAYELPRTSSILVSRYGEPAELKIEGI